MWMQSVRGWLRGQKECYITVAFGAGGCYFMPAVSTISILKHTDALAVGTRGVGWEKVHQTYHKRRSQGARRQQLVQWLDDRGTF